MWYTGWVQCRLRIITWQSGPSVFVCPVQQKKMVEEAINKGEIIRTHLLRPTWHFVSADDIYWILELTVPHIKSGMKSRHKQLG